MHHRKLGNTNLNVTVIGFGGRAIGGDSYGETEDKWSKVAIARAFGAGGRFIDTADRFGHGRSETLIGSITNCRADVIIATKGGFNFYDAPSAPHQDFSADYLTFAADESRRRLRKPVLDIYLLDEPTADALADGSAFDALDALKAAGKIRLGGVAADSPAAARLAVDSGRIDVLEITFNLLAHEPERLAVLKAAAEKGVGVIVKEPLANGALTGKFTGDETFPADDIRAEMPDFSARVSAARQFASLAQPNRTLAQAAILFALSHPAVAVVVPGCKTQEQTRENFATTGCPPLTPAEFRAIMAQTL